MAVISKGKMMKTYYAAVKVQSKDEQIGEVLEKIGASLEAVVTVT